MPTVTALRPERRGRVLVEVDGESWRVVPLDVAFRVGLGCGRRLDRPLLRELRRELRRYAALAVGARALGRRDLSTAALDERLLRAGVSLAERRDAVATLERAGLVDDERLARSRAETLLERDAGDAAIRHDLARRRISRELVERVVAELEPESERAERIVERRGPGAKTGRYLLRKGFSEETAAAVVARDPEAGYDTQASSDNLPA